MRTLQKFGDKQSRIVAWVMHSTNWFDLGVDGVENQIDSIAADIIRVLDVPGMGLSLIHIYSLANIRLATSPN